MSEDDLKRIQAALDEMDRLAAVHIQLQNDPSAIIKDVVEAERLRDRHEAYVEREARSVWLRDLLAEREKLIAVVAVAEAIVHDAEHDHHLATNWATERLKQALVAYRIQEAG